MPILAEEEFQFSRFDDEKNPLYRVDDSSDDEEGTEPIDEFDIPTHKVSLQELLFQNIMLVSKEKVYETIQLIKFEEKEFETPSVQACINIFGVGCEIDMKTGFRILDENPHDPTCVYIRGICHNYGLGNAEKDIDVALRLYQKAADMGSHHAITTIACQQAEDLDRCSCKNHEINNALKTAIRMGNYRACYCLAVHYLHGCRHNGKKRDIGMRLLKAAADNFYPIAMHQLAICYNFGIGTDINIPNAITWYRLAYDYGTMDALDDMIAAVRGTNEYVHRIVLGYI